MRLRWNEWLFLACFFVSWPCIPLIEDLGAQMRAPRIFSPQGVYEVPMRYKGRIYYVTAEDHKRLVRLTILNVSCTFVGLASAFYGAWREPKRWNKPWGVSQGPPW